MATTVARVAFASLSLSAKLHRLLDKASAHRARLHEAVFDDGVSETLAGLDPGPLRDEARGLQLMALKREFAELEDAFGALRRRGAFPEQALQRFDRAFTGIREKIREKELTL